MSLNNLLIHIGLHKTGTTWLQETLFSSDSQNFIPLSPDGDPKYFGKLFIWAHKRNLLSPFEANEKEIRKELLEILANIEIGKKSLSSPMNDFQVIQIAVDSIAKQLLIG